MRRARERQLERQTKRSRRLTKRAAIATGAALGATVVFAPSAQAAPFTVDTNADTPPDGCNNPDTTDECTLREAVYDANATPAPDTVTFAPTVTGEITLVASGGDINIHEPLDIQGPGASTLAVSGDSNANDMADSGDDRIFRVDPNTNGDPVSISDLTMTEGVGGGGGAIFSGNAELTIVDAALTDNLADGSGGALYTTGDDATLTITGSTVSDNIAGGSGGGVFTRSGKDGGRTLTISDTDVIDNTAMFAHGGGIDIDYLNGDGVIDGGSTISGNSAPDPDSGDGGGINVGQIDADNSPTADLTPGSLTFNNVTISDNDAGEDGGGVYLEYGSEGDESFANVTISGNTAGEDGGGLYVEDTDGTVTMDASVVSANSARKGGGIYLDDGTGAITIDKTTISANSSSRQGGGMYVDDLQAPVTIQNSTVSGNSAIDPADGQGGGIYANRLTTEPLTILNSTIASNAATNGGGIFRATAAPVLRSTIVADNAAQDGDLAQGIGAGGFFDVGFSLIEDRGTATISESPVGSNSFDLDPQLGPLAANGGSTQTHLPALGSPAIDAAVNNGFANDQRGSARTVDQSSVVNRSGADGTDTGSVELAQQGGQPPTPAQTLCQDVESKRLDGTAGDDSLTGTDGIDSIFGLAGNDILNGAIGPDCLDGGPGKDNLKGSGGKDLLRGGADNDKLRGQGGKDKLKGGAGNDNLIGDEGADNVAGGAGADKVSGGPAKDRIKGSGGADRINAVDENRDSVNCGGGSDEATVDAQDKVSNSCEDVTVVS